MFSVFTTIAFISAAILFLPLVSKFYKNSQKTKENLALRLSIEGTANNLTFCSQEMFENKVVGIDGINRKILIVEKEKKSYRCSLIALDEIQNCEVITSSGSIRRSEENNAGLKKNRSAIALQFEFKNAHQPASITFYDSYLNSKREMALLKAKAEYWRVMLSKMLTHQVSVSVRA